MKDLNLCQFIGRLGRDPEIKYTQSGKAVTNFTIAVNGYKDDVQWVNCVAWEKLAAICGEYLTKGKQVYVSGRQQTRQWEDQDGNKKYTTEIVIENMQMLGGGNRSDNNETQRGPEQTPEDDIPW